MKLLLRTFMLSIVVILFCSLKMETDSCRVIEKVKYTTIRQFSPEIKFGIESKKSVQLNKNEYKELFGRDKIETDTCFLFGKFNITRNRIGVYSLRSTYECDSRVEFVELHVFENCKIIDSKTIMIEDNHVSTYEVSSKLNKDFGQLTITEKVGSEYSEPNSEIDTLFINTYKIDLKSKNLDTIYRNSKFELLKSPPQK